MATGGVKRNPWTRPRPEDLRPGGAEENTLSTLPVAADRPRRGALLSQRSYKLGACLIQCTQRLNKPLSTLRVELPDMSRPTQKIGAEVGMLVAVLTLQ